MASSICISNCSNPQLHDQPPILYIMERFDYQPWVFSLLGSAIVGLAGILPLFIIRIDEAADLNHGASAGTLKILLSFAVGGLLGDVFLHLLPEAWANNVAVKENSHPPLNCGLWVLAGFLLFIIAEKIFTNMESLEQSNELTDLKHLTTKSLENNNVIDDKHLENNNCIKGSFAPKIVYSAEQMNEFPMKNGELKYEILHNLNGLRKKNGYANGYQKNFILKNGLELKNGVTQNGGLKQMLNERNNQIINKPKKVSGYLNLLANCIDNFTHGLAVGGSFLISFRIGALTTFAILVHEIPHEIGDFAILLKSGFSKWDAAKAQLLTASGGIIGALVAVFCSGDGIESKTGWILPFTAGGFLHIGMVSILPELLKETSAKESFKQLVAIFVGIILMAVLTIFCD